MSWHNDFNEVVDAIGKVGEAYAIAKAESYRMQELRSSILSELVLAAAESSLAKSEHRAKASEEYRQHVSETAKAIEEEHKLKAQLDRLKCQFEGYRSLISLEKKTIEKFE